MLANMLHLRTPLPPGVGLKYIFSYYVAYQINGKEAKTTMQANLMSFYTPSTLDGVKMSRHFSF